MVLEQIIVILTLIAFVEPFDDEDDEACFMLLYVVVSVACGLLDFLLESKMRVTEGESKIVRKGYLHCLQLAWQFFFIFLVSQLRKNISCFLHHLWLLRFAHRARFSISSKTGNMSERWKIQTDQLLWPEFK